MKSIVIKKTLVCLGILLIAQMVLNWLSETTVGTQYEWAVERFFILIVLLVIFFYIGHSIKKKHVKKKFAFYSIMFICVMMVFPIISVIIGVEMENTWLGFVGAMTICLVLVVILFDVAKSIKHTHRDIAFYLYFACVLMIVLITIFNIAFWLGYF